MVLINLTSDNFDDQRMTVDIYEEIVLQMSTGDHACHTITATVLPESAIEWANVIASLEDITDENESIQTS